MKVILLAALTLDGKLARNSDHFVDWTSREDKKLFFQTTKRAGALIIGNNTYKTLSAPLPGRLHIVLTSNPEGKENVPGVVEFTNDPPDRILAGLEARGYTEAVMGGGSQANTLFLEAGLIDEIWLTIEPVIFGSGIDLFTHALDFKANLVHFEMLNDAGSVHLRYSLR